MLIQPGWSQCIAFTRPIRLRAISTCQSATWTLTLSIDSAPGSWRNASSFPLPYCHQLLASMTSELVPLGSPLAHVSLRISPLYTAIACFSVHGRAIAPFRMASIFSLTVGHPLLQTWSPSSSSSLNQWSGIMLWLLEEQQEVKPLNR